MLPCFLAGRDSLFVLNISSALMIRCLVVASSDNIVYIAQTCYIWIVELFFVICDRFCSYRIRIVSILDFFLTEEMI